MVYDTTDKEYAWIKQEGNSYLKSILGDLLPFAKLNEEAKEVLMINSDHFMRTEYVKINDVDGYVNLHPFSYCLATEELIKEFKSS